MSNINIQVTATVAQAAKDLTAFTTTTSAGLRAMDVSSRSAAAGLAQINTVATQSIVGLERINGATATATNGLNAFTAAAIRSASASNNIVVLNGAAQEGARRTGDALKKTTGELNNSIQSVAIAASTFAGPTASSILTPLLLFSRELKTISTGLRLAGLSMPVLGAGIAGVSAILAVGSFYWADYRKATEAVTQAEDSSIETNKKLRASIYEVARARRDAGAITEQEYERVLKLLKQADNQVTVEGTAQTLRAIKQQLRAENFFPQTRGDFEAQRERGQLSAAEMGARMNLASVRDRLADPGNVRLIMLASEIEQIEKRRLDTQKAKQAGTISETEARKLEIADLTQLAALESERLNIQAQRIQSDFRRNDAEKYRDLRGLGVPKDQLGPNPDSLPEQMTAQWKLMQSQIGTIQQQIAESWVSVMNAAVTSTTQSVMGLLDGTLSRSEALRNIARGIAGETIQNIVRMGAQWVTTNVLMRGVTALTSALFQAEKKKEMTLHLTAETTKTAATVTGSAARSSATSAEASTEAVNTAAKGASSVADIPYVGWALAIAAFGSILGVIMAAVGSARAKGGPVTAGQPYLVGEEGPEIIMPKGDGYVLTASQTQRVMKQGTHTGTNESSSAEEKVLIYFANTEAQVRRIMESNIGKSITLRHVDEGKTDLGFQT